MTPIARWFGAALVLLVAAAPARAQEEKETPRGPGDGIKVHGHWTIDVKNPDGSLASHHEFENALTPKGADTLAAVLSRKITMVGWGVELGSDFTAPSLNPCQGPCEIVEPAVAAAGITNTNQSLTVSFSGFGGGVTLSGSAQAQNPSEIAWVA